MIKIKTLLTSVLILTLSFANSMAAGISSQAGISKTIPISSKTAPSATNGKTECLIIEENSTATIWNTGKICLVSGSNTRSPKFSVAADLGKGAGVKASQVILKDSHTLGAECESAGGSAAASEAIGGFCLASDLNTSITDFANFSVANELPVTGIQYLQVTFKNGSTLNASASIGAECISAGGSTSTPETSEGFCLASDLGKSTLDFASFAVANGLPVVGLQFLQVKFANGTSQPSSGASTNCASVGGSKATPGVSSGFCLASDLNTPTAKAANFSLAQDTPATDFQYLQVTFETGSGPSTGSLPSPGAGAPTGAECISVEGSIGASSNSKGFCLVSDLIESIDSTAISFANDLPVSGLQFLQAKFADGSTSGAPVSAECVSGGGSTAATGNGKGFCLVSDLIGQTTGSASFSVANALPVTTWEFLQVPAGAGAPVGVVVSNSGLLPFDLRSAPAPAGMVGSKTPFFHLSDQTSEMEVFSTPYWRLYPHLGIWVGR